MHSRAWVNSEVRMKRYRFTVEAIIRMLREAELHLSQGKSIAQESRELGITGQTYYAGG